MAVTTQAETSWFNAAGQLLAKAVPALDNKITKKYTKNQKAAVSDWAELVQCAANGEGEPAPDVLRAVAANMGMEPDRAMVTFTEDVAVFKKAMFQMKRLPKVLGKRADALGHVSEQEAFQKLKDEKEQLRLRLKKIEEEGTLIVQSGMGIANANTTINRAATNARLFPNGRADVVAAAGFTTDPIDEKELTND